MRQLLVAGLLVGSSLLLSGCALFDMFAGGGSLSDSEQLDGEIEALLADDHISELQQDEPELDEGQVEPERVDDFQQPPFEVTMKSRCGASVDYRYCKCAFHGEQCRALGVDRDGARSYLQGEFDAYVDDQLAQFQSDCEAGQRTIRDAAAYSCTTCPAGSIVEGSSCVLLPPVATGESEQPSSESIDDTELDQSGSGHSQAASGSGELAESGGACTRDSDCPLLCEGNVMRKQVCNGRTNQCEKWTDTDCTQVTTRVDWRGDEVYDIPNICVPAQGCVRGPIPVYERKAELQAERKALQAQAQELNQLYQQAAAFCLGTLSDPTGITTLAASSQQITTNSPETNQLIAQVAADPDTTQTSIRCTLEERLRSVDLPAVQAEVEVLFARIEELDQLTDIIDQARRE